MDKEDSQIQHLPATLCLKATVMEEENGFSDVACIDKMKEYAQYHRFPIAEEYIGHTFLGIRKNKGYQRYRQIFVRVLP